MPTFITIGDGDRDGYDRTAAPVRAAAHAQDDMLKARGAVMGIAGPPVQVRNHGAADLRTEQRPYLTSPLPVAGFAVIEAATMADAIRLVSQTPCAVAYGVVEIWPLEQPR